MHEKYNIFPLSNLIFQLIGVWLSYYFQIVGRKHNFSIFQSIYIWKNPSKIIVGRDHNIKYSIDK